MTIHASTTLKFYPAKQEQYPLLIFPVFLWIHTHTSCGSWLTFIDGQHFAFRKQYSELSDTG